MIPAGDAPTRPAEAGTFVTAFACAVKNLTIYPAQHPRVDAHVEELLACQRTAWPNGCELTLLHDTVRIDGQAIDGTSPAVPWLLQRARDAGVAGVVVEPGCEREHVLAFAQALVAARPGGDQDATAPWPPGDAPVRPVMLVVVDRHAQHGDSPGGRSAAEADPLANIAPALAARLREVAAAPEVRVLLEAAAATCRAADDPNDADSRELHLVGAIGELLPAELPNDVESLTGIVARVLQRLTRNLERMRDQHQLRSANMMQTALNVARKFFAREIALSDADRGLPTGRPGDERYAADLDALLREFAALPQAPGLRLPRPDEFTPDGADAAVELAGACLHAIVADPGATLTERRSRQLAALVAAHPEALTPLLDAYLAKTARGLPARSAMAMLEALRASPQGVELARRREYLHEDLLVRTFPIVLPLAADLLVVPAEHQRLRAALTRLSTLLANGGVQATAETGALAQPTVITLLAHVGGPAAHALLAAADAEAVPIRRALHALATVRRLPAPERVVLQLVPPTQLRGAYLRAMLRMIDHDRIDDAVRRESGELLLKTLHEALPTCDLPVVQAAIEALTLLPGTSPRRLLQHLRRWRWWHPGERPRTVRRAARSALQATRTRADTR